MYQDDYKRWLEHDLEDVDLKTELMKIKDDDDAIKIGRASCRERV